MVLLETNVDDVTGEVLGHLVARLLDAGAADAWLSPIVMKKGRPAHTVHVLAAPEHVAGCERLVLAETGSLGLRRTSVDRTALPRHTTTVDVGGHAIRVKHGPWGAKPEHDDVAAAAAALGLPLREVARRALAAAPDQVAEGHLHATRWHEGGLTAIADRRRANLISDMVVDGGRGAHLVSGRIPFKEVLVAVATMTVGDPAPTTEGAR